MSKSFPPEKKSKILKDLSSDLRPERVLREESISSRELSSLLLEAAGLFNKKEGSKDKDADVFIDGASRGNPGLSGAGVVIKSKSGILLAEDSIYLGEGTNNVAEYKALLCALEKAKDMEMSSLVIHSDSQLVVNQLNGSYRVKEPHLQDLYFKAVGQIKYFKDVRFVHVTRDKNDQADMLANRAIDSYIRNSKD